MSSATASIQKLADRLLASKWHNGVTLCLYDCETGKETHVGAGALSTRSPYFAPALSILVTSAILLQLREEGKIDLDHPFQRYMSFPGQVAELHVKDGIDRTDRITLRHLMSHRSGFGDFFLFKNLARTVHHDFANGVDSAWGFDEVLQRTRSHGAVAAPGVGRRARYADSNFHLLGRVIETVEGKSYADVVRDRVIDRLGLYSTYVYCDPSDHRPLDLMSRSRQIHVPRTMASLQADGGIVTTAREAVTFLRGFFEGYLFDKRILPHLYTWRPIFYPVVFGTGLTQVQPPWWMTIPHRLGYKPKFLLKPVPRMIGNVGIGGSFAYYAPDVRAYVSGTVNQLSDPARAVALAVHAFDTLRYEIRPEQFGVLAQSLPGQSFDMPPSKPACPDRMAASDRTVEFR
ncbi:serine hydrolase domain-containing protein [Celeribacter neptunius]|uniref:CubicO group peptidase, beta-lactamase class C family n=1 Tax=Celeribacter neptunius TaxID=588602 RepID=A0A1I3ISU7_9RHOB|nr:serine hydrolase domain-containing protein [Celeribacter neptunius]SFI51044.1 CubicO group peptidase, beta-lactamase class C family [Celeribacter neptunius]